MKSLSYKIGLGYGVLIFINIAIAVFAIYHINRLGSPISRILRATYQNVTSAENMAQSLYQQRLILETMSENRGDSTAISRFNIYRNEFLNWHQKAINGIALPAEPVILDSIQNAYLQFLARTDTLRNLVVKKKSLRLLRVYYRENLVPLAARIDALCKRLRTVNENAIARADARAHKFSYFATLVIITIAGIAISLSITFSIWFTRNIVRPVQRTTETVRKIGQGQLNQKVFINSDDEIAELGREFNKMTERLLTYERMNIQQILLEKKKSEAIVSNIPAAIIVTDQENNLSLLNGSAMNILKISGDDWQGKSIAEVVKDETLRRLLHGEPHSQEQAPEPSKSLVTLSSDGRDMHFLVRKINITDENQRLIAKVTFLQDVTRFKNLDRLKSDFMAIISHEFKTPLTSINMTIDILLREVQGKINQAQRELLGDAKQDCRRLNNLVKELLDLSRLESGQYPLNYQEISVPELLDYSLQPLRFFIEDKGIDLQINTGERLPCIRGDFHWLSKVVSNLVENAIEHSLPGGTVMIEARQIDHHLHLCVEDHGEGIPEHAIDLIFDKFVQVQNFTDVESGRIGLGLTIAREIVKAHQGKIWVESKPGQGSKFYFMIPLANESANGAPGSKTAT